MVTLSKRVKNITGQRFGSLVVLYPTKLDDKAEMCWMCCCDCGKVVEKVGTKIKQQAKQATDLRVPSCGCVQKLLAAENAVKRFTKHGLARNNARHPIYSLYWKIMGRCYNPNHTNFKNYGAKGVYVCEEWKNNPQLFFQWCRENGWKPGLQIDKDILCDKLGVSPKRYSPDTCQFVTQHRNLLHSATRSTYGTNKLIKFSHADVQEMNRLYETGLSKVEIARRFKMSKTHASRLIKTRAKT